MRHGAKTMSAAGGGPTLSLPRGQAQPTAAARRRLQYFGRSTLERPKLGTGDDIDVVVFLLEISGTRLAAQLSHRSRGIVLLWPIDQCPAAPMVTQGLFAHRTRRRRPRRITGRLAGPSARARGSRRVC